MKKYLIIIALFSVTLGACKKENCDPVNIVAPAEEITKLENYLIANSFNHVKDPRGFFYNITTPGDGNKPTVCNTVKIKYTGRYTTGGIFDSNSAGIEFELSKLIAGWQEAIPLLGNGGSMTLYLPPTLAYGAAGSGTIPPNTNLIFDIELISFK
jgi:FKBP-type peptidyl-prolyl cis-trans isomerase FkpA